MCESGIYIVSIVSIFNKVIYHYLIALKHRYIMQGTCQDPWLFFVLHKVFVCKLLKCEIFFNLETYIYWNINKTLKCLKSCKYI